MNAMQMMNVRSVLRSENSKQWFKVMMMFALFFGLMFLLSNFAHAADGAEFADAAGKFETWVKGSLGKLAAFVALAVGSVVAAVKKDWTWFFGAVVLSIGVGVVATVINASFTATI